MRFYKTFPEAFGEIKRDLAEMGTEIHSRTYQDKVIGDDPNMRQKEVVNYSYSVRRPSLQELSPTEPWASAELAERVGGVVKNPGEAWKLREEVWTEFLEKDGKFSYSYPERLWEGGQLAQVCATLRNDPNSRQAYLSMWDRLKDPHRTGGKARIPCSLGWWFVVRDGKLQVTYLQRSADFATHFTNDVFLAHGLQRWVAEKVGVEVGPFNHWIGSLHVFAKDVKGVF